ncbi:DUF2617 family protein [Gordonia sp. LSe1-13]|uniref:DUF2617 family protein n=1 Tax=Gordonia sesuvii TaxID=3116777 RepID=A0ABU7MBA4_9ACTN|nr:DUF2617 family protein [Gordonia sp. LSe1-13]
MTAPGIAAGHVRLDVAYADTSARQLAFSLSAAIREPLARCDHRFESGTVSLRLLGASHQILVDDGDRQICETVACLPGLDRPLPGSVSDESYSFTSSVEHCDAERLAEVVGDLRDRTAAHRSAGLPALLGEFPGQPLAVTAAIASARGDDIVWQTWHTYPQSAEVVTTTGELRGAGSSR